LQLHPDPLGCSPQHCSPRDGSRLEAFPHALTHGAAWLEGEARRDYLLVGGGLQNALIALAVLDRCPDTRLTLIEREAQLGGNHTWGFHAQDVPAAARHIMEPLVVKRWPAHDVVFPAHRRRVPDEYAVLTSERLHRAVTDRVNAAPHAQILTADVVELDQSSVRLADGRRLRAQRVIDARGPSHGSFRAVAGYQKFLGLELRLALGTAPDIPLLMDASVEQHDGFRFVYLLPWAVDRVLIEDTYYSSDARLDVDVLRERILVYAAHAGLRVRGVLREEQGVLPIPSALRFDASSEAPLRAGYAGGLFHPTTGYSLPVALRFALLIAAQPAGAALGAEYARWISEHRRQVRFCLWLNRLLFGAFHPARRYHVLERFYGLPLDTIRRFYALETTPADRARILCGQPPRGFSLWRLLRRETSS
jgi:lycopene beta-cyclase